MKKLDILLLGSVVFLSIFGLFMIYNASSFIAYRDFADNYYYVKNQIVWFVLGYLALLFFIKFDYHKFYNLALPILITALALLVLVFVPGFGLKLLGATRWIDFRIFTIQPSEIIKIALAIYLAAWFSTKEKGRLTAFLLLIGAILTLVMLQPDMGTATIILLESFAIYFLSGARLIYFAILAPVVFLGGIILAILEPYRAARLATFFNSNQDIASTSYHVRQILIALGSGGLTGLGFGNSLQKYAYLPENATDSIFAIVAEEIGFLGSTVIILIFAIIVWRGFKIASGAKDLFGKLLAGGIITYMSGQILLNLAAQTALVPLTGIPLPFISHGGTAFIINMTSIGILLNIKKQS